MRLLGPRVAQTGKNKLKLVFVSFLFFFCSIWGPGVVPLDLGRNYVQTGGRFVSRDPVHAQRELGKKKNQSMRKRSWVFAFRVLCFVQDYV